MEEILFEQGDCNSFQPSGEPPSSTAIPLLAFTDAPASRLPGQLASSLGLRIDRQQELGTWTANSNDSNKIPIGS